MPSFENSKTVMPARRRLNVPPERTTASRRAAEPFSAMTSRRTDVYPDCYLKGHPRAALPSWKDGFRLDLDEDLGAHQPPDLDHRRRRTDVAEGLRVRPPDLLPVVDVHHVHPRADHVPKAQTGGGQGRFDVPEGLRRLRIRIPEAYDVPLRVRGGGPRGPHGATDADGAGVSDDRLPARPARDVLPVHEETTSRSETRPGTRIRRPTQIGFGRVRSGSGTGASGAGATVSLAAFALAALAAFAARAFAFRALARAFTFFSFSRSAFAAAFAIFFGHCMFTQRTQGGRPRVITRMIGFPHASHRSSVVSMSPRWGSGCVLSHSGYRVQPRNRFPPRLWRMNRFPPSSGHWPTKLCTWSALVISAPTSSAFSTRTASTSSSRDCDSRITSAFVRTPRAISSMSFSRCAVISGSVIFFAWSSSAATSARPGSVG